MTIYSRANARREHVLERIADNARSFPSTSRGLGFLDCREIYNCLANCLIELILIRKTEEAIKFFFSEINPFCLVAHGNKVKKKRDAEFSLLGIFFP